MTQVGAQVCMYQVAQHCFESVLSPISVVYHLELCATKSFTFYQAIYTLWESQFFTTDFFFTTLNISIGEDGTNSRHVHNLAKSQIYQGLKLLLSDTKFMNTVNPMLVYHRFQEN